MPHRFWSASLALFVLACPALATPPAPHGGAFRGPNLPPPSPFTPGGGAAAKGGPSGTGGGLWRSSDPATWSQWWALDRDRYLRQVQGASGAWTGTDHLDGAAPGWGEELRNRAVPELIRIIQREKDQDLLTAAVMALAKIGLDPDGADGAAPKVTTLEAIQGLLGHGNQEVAESAVIALGVLGQSAAAEQLAHILHGDARAAGIRKISSRNRAFAAYALGVIGRRASAEAVRSFCVHHLAQELETADRASPDLAVACVISIGLIPLRPSGHAPGAGGPQPTAASSREGQFGFLMRRVIGARPIDGLPEGLRRLHLQEAVLAYIPMALARLSKGNPALRTQLLLLLPFILDPKSKSADEVRVGAVHALGHVVNASKAVEDSMARDLLLDIAKGGDRLERVLALAALGRIGGRGAGDPLAAVPREIRSFLMVRLAKGQTYETPWAALAVGLLEHGRKKAGEPAALGTLTALRHELSQAGNPDLVGSLCIALALAGDKDAVPLILKRADGGDETARGHAVTALGMLQAADARPLLRGMAADGRRPALAREAAIALALMGDREIQAQLGEEARTESFLGHQVSALLSLAYVGDRQALDPLLQVLLGRRQAEIARAYAAVALGIVFDKDPVPWNHAIAADVGWWRAPVTLLDPATGRGIVDLF